MKTNLRIFRWYLADILLGVAIKVAGQAKDGFGQDWYWSNVR